jgi:hypothetical protein
MIFLAMAMSQNGRAAKATGMSKIDCLFPAQQHKSQFLSTPEEISICACASPGGKETRVGPLEDSQCNRMLSSHRFHVRNQQAMNESAEGVPWDEHFRRRALKDKEREGERGREREREGERGREREGGREGE